MTLIRAAAVLSCAAVLLTGCTGHSGSSSGARRSPASAAQPPDPALAPYYSQHLRWSNCGGGFQCSTVEVPLDYTHPDGQRIKIAVIRLPAADPRKRIGSLLVNPGGPGGSGVDYARSAGKIVSPAVRSRFDIVGFDPRGVGRSDPVHCLTAQQLDRYLALDPTPDDKRAREDLINESRGFAVGCEKHSKQVLPYVGTADAARDMDVLRAALGDPGLTYLGKSYGTYLGAYYAEEFPKRVRALVLDGAIDPAVPPLQVNIVQAQGFELALRAFVADCVRAPTCPLGYNVSVDAGVKKIQDLVKKADRNPLPTSFPGRKLDEGLATLGILASLYDKGFWTYLRIGLQRAFAGDGSILLQLSDILMGRSANGTYTNQTEANMAVNCIDLKYPRSLSAYQRGAAQAQEAAPLFGASVMYSSLPCAYWPVRSQERPRVVHAAGAKPILVVGTTRDPATPYQWAQALARQLDSGVLLTRVGDGHTAYEMGNACIDQAVDRYLIDLKPPKNGTVCR